MLSRFLPAYEFSKLLLEFILHISRSKDFHDFLSHCVVKSPEMRSSAGDLLEVKASLNDCFKIGSSFFFHKR